MPKIIFTTEDLNEGLAELKKKNKFTPGFDRMTPDAAELWLQVNGEKLCRELNSGKYIPMPAIGFNTAKIHGGYRQLARLTAIDTIIQTAILEKITPVCDPCFSDCSFAYRRGRGTEDALKKYCEYGSVYTYAAKTDPRDCFDNLDHKILEKAVKKLFPDKKTGDLLMRQARMKLVDDGVITNRVRGVLQGSPLGSMFCNIYLDSLDKELEKKNIPFIRYADDIVIFGKSRDEAYETANFVSGYLRKKLNLETNEKKTVICESENIVFLGSKFFRDRNGVLSAGTATESSSAFYEWYESRPRRNRNSADILSDGILRQKDYSAIFETETDDSVIPLETIDRINIFSSVIFDNGFIAKTAASGVYVNIFSKNYDFLGRLVPASPLRDPRLNHEQLTAYFDPCRRLALAKQFDLASVHNLLLNIRYYNKHHTKDSYRRVLDAIDVLYKKMAACGDYNDLLLIEAQIRGLYYSCFDLFTESKPFTFGKRSKRPPLNEFNSLISFGNTVLYNYIATEIYKSSLDIRVGFLHATNQRAESLNLDIAEIFRPLIVDRTVFTLINRGVLKQQFFRVEDNGGVYLNETGKKLFLCAFYEKLDTTVTVGDGKMTYAEIISEEIRKLTRYFRAGEKYKAFRQIR